MAAVTRPCRPRPHYPKDRLGVHVPIQLSLPFGPIRNSEFLSNHWLDHRLPLEPEWLGSRADAQRAAHEMLALWQRERDRLPLQNEANLERTFVQPILAALGWHLLTQVPLRNRRPDYAMFLSDDALGEAVVLNGDPDLWRHASIVADAKAWQVSLDQPVRIGSAREYPPEQIEWYLDRSECEFGILTNGRLWRLVPRDIDRRLPRFQTYIEVDLPALLDAMQGGPGQLGDMVAGQAFDRFLTFYLLFGRPGHDKVAGRKALIARAVEGSSEYALGVGVGLKSRVFEALQLAVEGFLKHPANALDPQQDLETLREQSLVLLYRLLFAMFAEDRGLLPYRKNETYTANRSLARLRDEVAAKLDLISRRLAREDFDKGSTALWQSLAELFDLIDVGGRRYGVPAYNGGLFNSEGHPFLEENAIGDWHLARIIDRLGRALQPDRPEIGLVRVDYRDLAIQQLGDVYEGLIELHPRYAAEDMIVVSRRAKGKSTDKVVPAASIGGLESGFSPTGIQYPAGSVYLENDKGERQASGSYYTPDQIVSHMVSRTLGEKCREITTQIEREIADVKANAGDRTAETAALVRELEGAFDDRVLKLRVLDPAMGSGHFLIRACQFLAEEIATNPYTYDLNADAPNDESVLTYWKRRVAENCLYGVDLNPMAVELAKLALWLETAAADAPLTFLDHHLQHGDSLIGARVAMLDEIPGERLTAGSFALELTEVLPKLLDPLEEISPVSYTHLRAHET